MLLLTVIFPQTFFGQETERKPGEVHFGGFSPDRSVEMKIAYWPDDASYSADLKFMSVKTGRMLSRFSYCGPYDRALSFDVTNYTVSWREDGRCVGFTHAFGKGFAGTDFYAPYRGGWVKMALPVFDGIVRKMSRAAGESRVQFYDGPAGGHEGDVQWLPGNRFRMTRFYSDLYNPRSRWADAKMGYWITFRVVDADGKTKPRIVLEKVQFEPDPVDSLQ